ncbi:hypothetical protein TPA0908_40920 [Micromonospora sp. AKA38]|nr:hypothetical protein TPA0908_40920 [Micromonospora sp. AKA38]
MYRPPPGSDEDRALNVEGRRRDGYGLADAGRPTLPNCRTRTEARPGLLVADAAVEMAHTRLDTAARVPADVLSIEGSGGISPPEPFGSEPVSGSWARPPLTRTCHGA